MIDVEYDYRVVARHSFPFQPRQRSGKRRHGVAIDRRVRARLYVDCLNKNCCACDTLFSLRALLGLRTCRQRPPTINAGFDGPVQKSVQGLP
jgi:hypothetical protein